MKFYTKISKFLLIGLVILSQIKCGSGDSNSIRLILNGNEHEMALRNPRCDAGPPSGVGLFNAPVVCSAGFTNTQGISDSIVFTITDARAIQDQLGTFIPITPSLLIFSVTVDGTQYAVTNGGAVFNEISNELGGSNCFKFQFDAAQISGEGNFCGSNATGY